ncbi:MAG: bacteriophage Gp15 family protein [Lachnospiraceae bacterium]|nr:bacteriophage Gp15 family protein [Lachnospiraceae bacterium]
MSRILLYPQNREEAWYDIEKDWELIEASFLKQYGIRLRSEDNMSWSEFCSLLSGIMPDTPLGRVVAIRSEKDLKVIKNFTKEQKQIRNEYLRYRNQKLKENPKAYYEYWKGVQGWAKNNFRIT